jgi:hypothetical protein
MIGSTSMSCEQVSWHERRNSPYRPRSVSFAYSASVITSGSPATKRTRQVVQRALPPQRWPIWTPMSSIAFTSRLSAGHSALWPATVSVGMLFFLALASAGYIIH